MTKIAAYDTETHKIQEGILAPPLVVGSYADTDGNRFLLTPDQAREMFRHLMTSDTIVTFANAPFDMAVMIADAERMHGPDEAVRLLELVFAKYNRGRTVYPANFEDGPPRVDGFEVHDILVAQALDAIAGGHLFEQPNGGPLLSPKTGSAVTRYSLDVCTMLNLGRSDAKRNDFWRERYAILERVPMAEWPLEARQYPVDDVVNTLENALHQLGLPIPGCKVRLHEWQPFGAHDACVWCGVELGFGGEPACIERDRPVSKRFRNIDGMMRECRADLALHFGALWGARTDRKWVEALSSKVQGLHAAYVQRFDDFFRKGHEPGCYKKATKLGVALVTCVRCNGSGEYDGEPDGRCTRCAGRGVVPPEHACVTTCDDGKEDLARVKRLLVHAYAGDEEVGPCPACSGQGRRVGAKGNPVGCAPRNFKHELEAEGTSITCDCTGLDVEWPALPRTETGGVKADRDTKTESGDETLMAYADDEFEKIKDTYVPYLMRGVNGPLTFSPNVLVSSLRMSYFGVNQQMPRDGEPRTCFAARTAEMLGLIGPESKLFCELVESGLTPDAAIAIIGGQHDMVYASLDYSGIELCTLAQTTLWLCGRSRMAEIINETGDPGGLHAAFGAQMLGISVEEFNRRRKAGEKLVNDIRQAAKPCNFGFGGGMGAAKFVITNRKKNAGSTTAPDGTVYAGIRFCILLAGAERCGVEKVAEWKGRVCSPVCKACCMQAEILRNRWLQTFPEMVDYFEVISTISQSSAEVRLPFPGAVRGRVSFTDGANGHFQGLAAILMKTALWRISTECYVDASSPLYRTTRTPFVVHDECFAETLASAAHLTAPRIGLIMEQAGAEICPDVKVKVEPAISRRWLKAMEGYYVDGRLAPWEDGPKGLEYLATKGWTL